MANIKITMIQLLMSIIGFLRENTVGLLVAVLYETKNKLKQKENELDNRQAKDDAEKTVADIEAKAKADGPKKVIDDFVNDKSF